MINAIIIGILSLLFGILVGMDISNSMWKKRIDDLMEEQNGKDKEF